MGHSSSIPTMLNSIRIVNKKLVDLAQFGELEDTFLDNIPMKDVVMLEKKVFTENIYIEYLKELCKKNLAEGAEEGTDDLMNPFSNQVKNEVSKIPTTHNLSRVNTRTSSEETGKIRAQFLAEQMALIHNVYKKRASEEEEMDGNLELVKPLLTKESYQKHNQILIEAGEVQIVETDVKGRIIAEHGSVYSAKAKLRKAAGGGDKRQHIKQIKRNKKRCWCIKLIEEKIETDH